MSAPRGARNVEPIIQPVSKRGMGMGNERIPEVQVPPPRGRIRRLPNYYEMLLLLLGASTTTSSSCRFLPHPIPAHPAANSKPRDRPVMPWLLLLLSYWVLHVLAGNKLGGGYRGRGEGEITTTVTLEGVDISMKHGSIESMCRYYIPYNTIQPQVHTWNTWRK